MTKIELQAILNEVDDDARITIVLSSGIVLDVGEFYFAKSDLGFRNKDEVFLHHVAEVS